jgi:hypothetical protein
MNAGTGQVKFSTVAMSVQHVKLPKLLLNLLLPLKDIATLKFVILFSRHATKFTTTHQNVRKEQTKLDIVVTHAWTALLPLLSFQNLKVTTDVNPTSAKEFGMYALPVVILLMIAGRRQTKLQVVAINVAPAPTTPPTYMLLNLLLLLKDIATLKFVIQFSRHATKFTTTQQNARIEQTKLDTVVTHAWTALLPLLPFQNLKVTHVNPTSAKEFGMYAMLLVILLLMIAGRWQTKLQVVAVNVTLATQTMYNNMNSMIIITKSNVNHLLVKRAFMYVAVG